MDSPLGSLRQTKVVLTVYWDSSKREHPAGWDYNFLLVQEWPEHAELLEFEDEEE